MTKHSQIKLFTATIIAVLIFAIILLGAFICAAEKNVALAYEEDVIFYGDDTYLDNGESTTVTEYINYSTKTSSAVIRVNNTFPGYYNTNTSLTNYCANVAGANLVGFYDRYYEDLIPNCVPGIARGNNYTYYAMTNNLALRQAVINDLYIKMGTNNPDAGTSQVGFKNGLTSYMSSKSRSISFVTMMTNGALDINKLSQALGSGKPVALYLSGYNITQIQDTGTTVTLSKGIYTGNHIMIVYGYWTENYYNSSNVLLQSKTYLYVATGLPETGIYVLNNNGTINDAESVYVN